MVNHFEYHFELSNKQHLIKNLIQYCESIKVNPFTLTPLTFIIDCEDEMCESFFNHFIKIYNSNMPSSMKKKQTDQRQLNEQKRKIKSYFSQYQIDRNI